jgi:hypothetical protein
MSAPQSASKKAEPLKPWQKAAHLLFLVAWLGFFAVMFVKYDPLGWIKEKYDERNEPSGDAVTRPGREDSQRLCARAAAIDPTARGQRLHR